MRTQRILSHSTAIPSNLPPAALINSMQSFIPFLSNHKTMTRYSETTPSPEDIADDPFFNPSWDDSIRSFDVTELVTLGPGISKEVTYKVVFQHIPDGMRSRAEAPAGVVIRAEYSVRPRIEAMSPAGSESTGSPATAVGEEFELHEDVAVEANSLMIPFIVGSVITAHQTICSGVIDEACKIYFGTGN
ncbi:hypothetical protein EDB81DRAFT_86617 [Dactylonectria macrodidyma]|uniref:DUF7053 domain-containing protein n=1 Tax=Dactylonectria macrodidyma TaxID=307937 RepID=A0A9P9IZG9_9HYPO|nr:hypothetical protein EDB81DRAFT_86617 [Dactylonectria macrodidyma]